MKEPMGVSTVRATVFGCLCGNVTRTIAIFGKDHGAALCTALPDAHKVRGALLICSACGRVACLPCLVIATHDLTAGVETTIPPCLERQLRDAAAPAPKAQKPS